MAVSNPTTRSKSYRSGFLGTEQLSASFRERKRSLPQSRTTWTETSICSNASAGPSQVPAKGIALS
jgi:hypothetical protein